MKKYFIISLLILFGCCSSNQFKVGQKVRNNGEIIKIWSFDNRTIYRVKYDSPIISTDYFHYYDLDYTNDETQFIADYYDYEIRNK